MDSTTATSGPSPRKPGLLINRAFGLLLSGQTISLIGDYVFTTTLVIWVAQLTAGQGWSPLAVAAVPLAAAVPMALFGPLAGVFVDRWDKRRTMLRTDVLRAVLVALLILVSGVVPLPFVTDGHSLLLTRLVAIYATVFIVNAADRFFRPAQFALIGDIVPPEYQPRAFAFAQTTVSLAIIVGPPIAAPLLITFGPVWALAINAASFVVSFLTIAAIRPPKAAVSVQPGERGHFFREFATGLRFVLGTSALVTLLAMAMIIMVGGGALNALDIFFVTQNLRTPASLYGLLSSAQGIGLIGGALLGAMLATRLGWSRAVWGSVLLMGLLIVVYSRLTLFWPAVAVLFLASLPNGVVNTVLSPMILRITPREMVGRVVSMLDPVVMIASIVGTALAGYLDAEVLRGFHQSFLGMRFGPVDTIFLGAGVLFLLGGLLALAKLRVPDVTPAEGAEEAATIPPAADLAPLPASEHL